MKKLPVIINMKHAMLCFIITFSFSLFSLLSEGQFTVIHNFAGNPDGAAPAGSLTLSGKVLYGMTKSGGVNDDGNVFSIDSNGNNYKDLLDFDGTNGENPLGSLTYSKGVLYGMTQVGGASGLGVIFSIDTNGTHYKDEYNFPGGSGGSAPIGSLTLSGKVLYGMTASGGPSTDGNIFSIDTDGTDYSDLLDFNGTNGANPYGDLTLSGNKLFGMTSWGGANPLDGCIFCINTNGSGYKDLLDFDGTNGQNPYGDLIISGKKLFGMASNGGSALVKVGLVFSLDTNGGGFKDLFDFDGTNGQLPDGTLTLSGKKLFGMANQGGAHHTSANDGCIFSLDTSGGGYRDLLDFNGTNGENPAYGALTRSGKVLFGMASQGGTGTSYGVIFRLDTNNTQTSVNEITANNENIKIYPNPAKDEFYVQLQNASSTNLIGLYTITGQQVMEMKTKGKRTMQVSTGNLAEGTYLLKVAMEDGSSIMNKVVIMK